METIRPRRARLAAAGCAAAIVGAVGAWIAASVAATWATPVGAIGAAAFALAASRASSTMTWALALLGGEYAAALEIAGGVRVDGRAPLVAAALVLAAELSAWSDELELEVPHEPGMLARRGMRIALVAVGAAAVAAGVLGLAAAPLDAGVGGDALGVAAAVAAFALLARLARS